MPDRFQIHVVLAVALSVCAACDRDPAVLANKHFHRAQEFLKQSKSEEAIIELRRVAQLQPNRVDARNELGRQYVNRGDLRSAYREVSAAVHYDSKNIEALTMMGEILLSARKFSGARDVAGKILDQKPDDRNARLIMVESMIGLGESERARELIEQMMRADPKDTRALFHLARIQLHREEWETAEENLRLSWSLDPDDAHAALLLSQVYDARQNLPDAEKVLKELAGANANKLDLLYTLGTFYMKHQRLREAEEVFKRIADLGGADPKHRGSLGVFYSLVDRKQDARKEFQRIRSAAPEDAGNLRRLAKIELSLNRRDDARKILSELKSRQGPKDIEALLMIGILDIQDGKPDQAELVLTEAASAQPRAPMVHFQLARPRLLQGKVDPAKDALRDALRLAPEFTAASVVLAEQELRGGEPLRAVGTLTETVKRNPGSVAPNLLMAQAHAQLGQYQLADKELGRLLEHRLSTADQARVFEALAWVKLRQKRFEEARTFAEKLLSSGHVTLKGLQVLGLSQLGLNRPEQAVKAVQPHVQKAGRWAAGQDLLGELAVRAGQLELAETFYQAALDIEPQSVSALVGLGAVHERRRRYDLARQHYERAVSVDPRNVTAHFHLGALAEVEKKWNQAISEYRKVIEIDPSFAIAKNNLAWILAEYTDDLDEALQLAQQASAHLPKDPVVADTLAWTFIKQDRTSRALPLLQRCVSEDPKNPLFRYHLGVAYAKLGRKPEARQELESALRLGDAFEGSADAMTMLRGISGAAR